MDINLIRSLVSVALVAAFIWIGWWAYGSARRSRFELDAQLPFSDVEDDKGSRQ